MHGSRDPPHAAGTPSDGPPRNAWSRRARGPPGGASPNATTPASGAGTFVWILPLPTADHGARRSVGRSMQNRGRGADPKRFARRAPRSWVESPSPRLPAPRARCVLSTRLCESRATLSIAAEEVDVEAELREIVAQGAEAREVAARAHRIEAAEPDAFARRHADVVDQEDLGLDLAGQAEGRLVVL